MNDGRLLYQTSYYIYYFSDGVTKTEAEDATLLKVQRGTGTFLYRTDEGLFSKEPGRKAKLLVEEPHGLFFEFQYSGSFIKSIVASETTGLFSGDRFLMGAKTYKESTEKVLYDQELYKDKVTIAVTDSLAIIDHRLNNVIFQIFEKDGPKTYLSSKGNNRWSEPKMIFDFPVSIYNGDCPEFDSADRFIYCLEHNNYNRPEGGFWRYDIEKGKAEKLMDGTTGFFLIHDIPYVYTEDGIWKVMDGKPFKIADDTAGRYEDFFVETDGGAFFVSAANDIYYIKDDEDRMMELFRADWVIDPSYGMRLDDL